MSGLTGAKIPTDTWISASWNDYLQVLANLDQGKSYYYNHQMRLEMSPVGNDHASDHNIIIYAVNLFAAINNLDINGKDNCSYRKAGVREAQPDASFYLGETANSIPWGTGIIDLDQYPPPTLVIEVAKTSFLDDTGKKRLLYEDLGVSEYWIIDVENVEILAFTVENRGSRRIQRSQVLTGLEISLQKSPHAPTCL